MCHNVPLSFTSQACELNQTLSVDLETSKNNSKTLTCNYLAKNKGGGQGKYSQYAPYFVSCIFFTNSASHLGSLKALTHVECMG